jgi:nicotinate-nucleotide adenylyltransferase
LKVGLFFGSFNPIHIGHLIIANTVLAKTDIQKVMFVVSPQNPFKKSDSLIPEFDRLEMVRLAIFDNLDFEVSDIEFNMPTPSYTSDTLAYLTDKYPEREFSIILGEDNLTHFDKWKNYEAILKYHRLIVYPRPKAEKSQLTFHNSVKMINAPLMEISATFIRDCVRNDESIMYLVHPEVEKYIERKKIYL